LSCWQREPDTDLESINFRNANEAEQARCAAGFRRQAMHGFADAPETEKGSLRNPLL
jgi:hypothetical protein